MIYGKQKRALGAMTSQVRFEEISPADFFYRNRDLAGFTNPARSLYMCIRELVENSLDATEIIRVPPNVWVQLEPVNGESERILKLTVKDNGVGVDGDKIPKAFGTVLYGSKYGFKQSRGTFGVGGTMALLYGQITTNQAFTIASSTGGKEIHEYKMMIDIVDNKPKVLEHKVLPNQRRWRGTIVKVTLEGDYAGSRSKILEYFTMSAIVNANANIVFVDPRYRLYVFRRVIEDVPEPPKEGRPHPLGVDVETVNRLLANTKSRDVRSFLVAEFQRMGPKTAEEVLKLAGIDRDRKVKDVSHDEVTKLVEAFKSYGKFRAPETSTISPVGVKFIEAGLRAIYRPDFLHVVQRPPSSYSGIPFVVEAAIAYGGSIEPSEEIHLLRFANKIPLLYDEKADVSWKVISERIDWSSYKVQKGMPVLVLTSVCSPKVPYKTVGKEAISDRPEIERELTIAIRECARNLRLYLSRLEKGEAAKRRLSVYARYLPMIAKNSAYVAGTDPPDVMPLLRSIGVTARMVEEETRALAEELAS
ncbi:MAG: DNA topoisomerase VI subunit B [Thaumarchaeota archaeon]|nr:DNA topoisomerase VI subunit B [Candidatus Calditenuaceae archaeon]MDW8186730.1 DNA topoisomerase VI subunit B [Nitrososphaerota archaeon]